MGHELDLSIPALAREVLPSTGAAEDAQTHLGGESHEFRDKRPHVGVEPTHPRLQEYGVYAHAARQGRTHARASIWRSDTSRMSAPDLSLPYHATVASSAASRLIGGRQPSRS